MKTPPVESIEHRARSRMPENKALHVDEAEHRATAQRFAHSDIERRDAANDAAIHELERKLARQRKRDGLETPRCSSGRAIQLEETPDGPLSHAIVHADDGSVCECPGDDAETGEAPLFE
jgi:hypothetical protein